MTLVFVIASICSALYGFRNPKWFAVAVFFAYVALVLHFPLFTDH